MTSNLAPPTSVVAIAGASGYVGKAVVDALSDSHHVVALSRSAPAQPAIGPNSIGVEPRRCDLFSLRQLTQALQGVEVAVYLVHSMLPSARLTQASFEDLDLILADNFARAAAAAGVKKIVYLGGILPDTRPLSPHLQSRLEVERALGACGVPVIALRAGLVVGRKGSSFLILQRLVERLPAMILPAWAKSRTQPIALPDVVELIRLTVIHHEPETANYDIAGPDILTYKEMIIQVAEALGRRSPLLDIRWFSPKLSCLWISLVSGQPYALVAPLVQSLQHEMLAHDSSLMNRFDFTPTEWSLALQGALPLTPDSSRKKREKTRLLGHQTESLVRSVQRLPRPPGVGPREVALAYIDWLPQALRPLVAVDVEDELVRFRLRFFRTPFLILKHSSEGSHEGRELFHVIGGALAARSDVVGRLEFRLTPDGKSLLAAIHEFRPRLPWYLYRSTQAVLHLWVMRSFGRYLNSREYSERRLRQLKA